MLMPLPFNPLTVAPFPLVFMREAPHLLLVALMLPPLALSYVFPLMLETLFLHPMAMTPFPLGFKAQPPQGPFVSLLVDMAPVG